MIKKLPQILKLTFLFFGLTLLGTSCSSVSETQTQIEGKWMMKEVLDGEKSVIDQMNPNNDRWIAFAADGGFKSGGTPYGDNAGKWQLDNNNLLYLDSDAGEGDDSYWIVSIEENQMTWKGANSEFTERFTLIHEKAAE